MLRAPSKRAAIAVVIAALALFGVGALSFGAPSATATGGLSPLELAQVQRDNCRIMLAHATSSAQRTRANTCIADQTVIINALTVSPSPSGSPTPTPPGPTTTPTPSPTSTPTPAPTTLPPTPTPTATAVPTPTPTGPSGFPTPGDTAAGSTGWRHTGVTLTTHAGLMRITTPGAVVDSVLAVDGIEVQADNVTIKRSWVQGAGTGPGAGIWIDDGVTGTTIVDVEVSSRPSANDTVESSLVDRAITAGSGKHSSGITMLRVYAHRMIRGLQFSCGTVIADSWVGDEVNPSTDHMSAVGGDTCAAFSLTVDHNTIRLSPDPENSAALLYYPPQVGAYGNQHVAITITNNYITGGTYCMWLSSDPQLDGSITVTGNRFGTDYYPACGRFGTIFTDALPSQHGPGPLTITWSDNLLGSLTVVAPHG